MIWVHTASVAIATWISHPSGNPISEFWRRNMDPALNPFKGLYTANAFDLAIMLPYFVVMTVLACTASTATRWFTTTTRTARTSPGLRPK